MITLKINMVVTKDYYSLILTLLRMKLKTANVYEDFNKDKEMFSFSAYSGYVKIL